MKLMSGDPLLCSVSFIKMSPVPVPKKIKIGNIQLVLCDLSFCFFLPTTNVSATSASMMPMVAIQFSRSLNSITPAKVGNTTESLLDSEVTVTPERWVEAVIST